jgi:hypothetical protein
MNRISRFATAVLVSGGMSLAGLGLATGIAQADPVWGPSYSGGELPGCRRFVHSLVPWRPPDPGEPSHHLGLEHLPRLVLELGGCRRHCLQHDLPVAWRPA